MINKLINKKALVVSVLIFMIAFLTFISYQTTNCSNEITALNEITCVQQLDSLEYSESSNNIFLESDDIDFSIGGLFTILYIIFTLIFSFAPFVAVIVIIILISKKNQAANNKKNNYTDDAYKEYDNKYNNNPSNNEEDPFASFYEKKGAKEE